MKKIFILEDNPERILYFTNVFFKHYFIIVNNVEIGTIVLKKYKFDILFLDHDLGGDVYVDSNEENTGYQLCKQLVKTKNNNVNTIIHSWNEPAANQMLQFLRENCNAIVNYYPFNSNNFNQVLLDV